jgi:hypothetical protein
MKMKNLFLALIAITIAAASCKKDKTPDADGITLSKITLSLKVGQIDSIQANITPPEASQEVIWKSSDTTIAKVNQRGVITAVKLGVDTVKATTPNGQFSAVCIVNVIPENFSVNGSVYGVWKRGNTYTVTDHLNIPKDSSLTIEEGVTVIFADSSIRAEIIVNGNLYCMGTAQYPIKLTVPENMRTQSNIMKGLWGGIIGSKTNKEMLLLYTTIEYAGAVTKASSPSVIAGLYKAVAGQFDPAIYVCNNTDGKLVVEHCTIRYNQDDVTYLEGGSVIFAYNTFNSSGLNGGDVMNFKSGTTADCSFNLVYSANTNGFKLSNSGSRTPQAHIVGYNNTFVNCGWRRPDVKGGSIWLENSVYAELYNNLLANDRFGIKNPKLAADARSVYDYTYYYGYTQTGVNQFQTSTTDVVRGTHDVAGTTAGSNDPLFVNYPVATDVTNYIFDAGWDFHLKAGSPALAGANTSFARNFGTTGISIKGVVYNSPAPAAYFGAFGTN